MLSAVVLTRHRNRNRGPINDMEILFKTVVDFLKSKSLPGNQRVQHLSIPTSMRVEWRGVDY